MVELAAPAITLIQWTSIFALGVYLLQVTLASLCFDDLLTYFLSGGFPGPTESPLKGAVWVAGKRVVLNARALAVRVANQGLFV